MGNELKYGEWQPIETAPKDEKRYDLWHKYDAMRYPNAYWHKRDRVWICGLYSFGEDRFSHWMPLPEPPK